MSNARRGIAPRHGIGSSIATIAYVLPSIFTDCFGPCTGSIDHAHPGPVCGWLFTEPFGNTGGSGILSPGQMAIRCTSDTNFPCASKTIPSALTSVLDISGEYTFTCFATAPVTDTTYGVDIITQGNTDVLVISLFGDGSVIFQFGPVDNANTYIGAWTPDNATHKVNFSVTSEGVPEMSIDNVPIPLIFFGAVPTAGALFPSNSVSINCGSASVATTSAVFTSMFITSGVLPDTTKYRCPIA